MVGVHEQILLKALDSNYRGVGVRHGKVGVGVSYLLELRTKMGAAMVELTKAATRAMIMNDLPIFFNIFNRFFIYC